MNRSVKLTIAALVAALATAAGIAAPAEAAPASSSRVVSGCC